MTPLNKKLRALEKQGEDNIWRTAQEAREWIEQLEAENDMLRKVNTKLGIEVDSAETILKRWVAFFESMTRSEPFACIAVDSRNWIKRN